MKNAIAAEFLKLRRSRVLLLALLVSVLPSIVKWLRALPIEGGTDWQKFLASGQELSVFGLLIAVMLLADYVVTMEYRLNTAASVFTTQTGRGAVYLAKLLCLGAIVCGMLIVSAAAQLLFGWISASGPLSGELLTKFFKVVLWYAGSFTLLAIVSALPAVLAKRFVPAAVITLGCYLLTFPFHSKSVFGCFFMTPVIVAAKSFGSVDYIFAFDYKAVPASAPTAASLLLGLALIAFLIGLLDYRRADVPK